MSEHVVDWDLALIQKYNYSGHAILLTPLLLSFHQTIRWQIFLWQLAATLNGPYRCMSISRFATNSATSVAVINR